MAEVASAIVGLVGAGAKVSISFYNLCQTIRDAPHEFRALSDEISDFRSILSRLLEIIDSDDGAAIDDRHLDDLRGINVRGGEILCEIEELARKVRKEDEIKEGVGKAKRMKWVQHMNQAERIKMRLRDQKATLCNVISLTMVRSAAINGLRLSRLEMKIDSALENQVVLLERQTESLALVETIRGTPASGRIVKQRSPPTGYPEDVKSQIPVPRKGRARNNQAGPLRCIKECPCRCHYRAVIRSPQYMADWLGDFFVGCANLPWAFSGLTECTEQTCRRDGNMAADIRYFLPSWVGQVMGSCTVSFNVPKINVRVHSRNTIPYDSPILICAQEGDVSGARKLLSSSQASIHDVDPYGLGVLYYAACYGWRASGRDAAVTMCRFLLDLGASRDWDDECGNTPKENMIENTLMSPTARKMDIDIYAAEDLIHISQLFEEPMDSLIDDFIQEREISTLHQVLLGIDEEHTTVEEYLASFEERPLPPEIIDPRDASGRTPLAWAVEHIRDDVVRTLLAHGADARQARPNLSGALPMLHLAMAGPAEERSGSACVAVVRALLQHGADPNGLDHEGWTPLHVAASWNNAVLIRELVTFSDVELAWDAKTSDNETAADLALGAGYVDDVQAILASRGLPEGVDEFYDCE